MGKELSEAAREKKNARNRRWGARNKERKREYDRQWRAENAEHKKAYSARWNKENYERKSANQRAWREANKVSLAASKRVYYEANKEKICERDRAYRKANKARLAEKGKARRQTNLGRMCIRRSNAKRKRSLGWVALAPNPFPSWVPIDYHHVDDRHVLALPRTIHRANYAGPDTEKHRRLLESYVSQIYGDISKLLEPTTVIGEGQN